MTNIMKSGISLLTIMVALASFSFAQSFTGGITGTVLNSNGEVVPNAEITITQTQTGKVVSVTANGEGYYVSPPLVVGD